MNALRNYLLILASLSGHAAAASSADCARYIEAFDNSSILSTLTAWRNRLPEKFEISNFTRLQKYHGFGRYSIPLDFDPKTINLGPQAHAEISIDPESKKVRFAAISDSLNTGFVFRFKDYDYKFESRALKSPRSGDIGVACAEGRMKD